MNNNVWLKPIMMHRRVNGLKPILTDHNIHPTDLKINKMKRSAENKIQILKDAIRKGIDSGIAKDFNAEKHLQFLKDKMKKSN
ncbi:hypothetical protein [Chryseobacterium hagamense]|uniref:Uncharacterized protein n=1 Tax=Chryseobacterium hagamense TaxID=395935 RepID=A0A511YPV4_9FLAO|nr:hypothetical protein [Chryseobacterium hagamense]GEN77206.1 hypothetical protein CHA01nite_29460 [Chryseobacterium hagamense]